MKKTTNYQLNQWAMSDRIQMKDFNDDNAQLESALTGLESRKLELIPVMDISVTLTTETFWTINLREMRMGERMAVFFFFTFPDSSTRTLNYGSSTSGRVVWLYGKNAGFMGVPLRMATMPVTLLPLGGVQEVTPRNSTTFQNLECITIYNYTVNTAMKGTFRFQGFAIP